MNISFEEKTELVCPICGEFLSLWYGTMSTMVAFHSPVGHNHDDNCKTRRYVCKNEHLYIISKINKCPSCDWEGKKECFCHPHKKAEKWFEEGEPILLYLIGKTK